MECAVCTNNILGVSVKVPWIKLATELEDWIQKVPALPWVGRSLPGRWANRTERPILLPEGELLPNCLQTCCCLPSDSVWNFGSPRVLTAVSRSMLQQQPARFSAFGITLEHTMGSPVLQLTKSFCWFGDLSPSITVKQLLMINVLTS